MEGQRPAVAFVIVYAPIGADIYKNPENLTFSNDGRTIEFDWVGEHGHRRHIRYFGVPYSYEVGDAHDHPDEQPKAQKTRVN